MEKWFNKQSLLVKVLLLLIPFVNWIVEVLVRWSSFIRTGKISTLLVAIIVTFFGLFVGWIDLIWVIVTGRLTFTK
jgi:hypothetical protein